MWRIAREMGRVGQRTAAGDGLRRTGQGRPAQPADGRRTERGGVPRRLRSPSRVRLAMAGACCLGMAAVGCADPGLTEPARTAGGGPVQMRVVDDGGVPGTGNFEDLNTYRVIPPQAFDLIARVARAVASDPSFTPGEQAEARALLRRLPAMRNAAARAGSAGGAGGGARPHGAAPSDGSAPDGWVVGEMTTVTPWWEVSAPLTATQLGEIVQKAGFGATEILYGSPVVPLGLSPWFGSPAASEGPLGDADCKREVWALIRGMATTAGGVLAMATAAEGTILTGGTASVITVPAFWYGAAGTAGGIVDMKFAYDDFFTCISRPVPGHQQPAP